MDKELEELINNLANRSDLDLSDERKEEHKKGLYQLYEKLCEDQCNENTRLCIVFSTLMSFFSINNIDYKGKDILSLSKLIIYNYNNPNDIKLFNMEG